MSRNTIALLHYTVVSNLRAEVRRFSLSYLWWVLEPAFHLIILYLVFGMIFGRGKEDFIPFLFCGLVPWFWFNKVVMHGMDSIVDGRVIIKDVYIHKLFFPWTRIAQDTVKQIPVFIMLFAVVILYGAVPSGNWLWFIPVFFSQLLLISGIALLASLLTPFLYDFKYLMETVLQALMFASGIFYSFQELPEEYHEIFFLNPVAVLINLYRQVLMHNSPPALLDLMYITSIGVGGIILAYALHRVIDTKIPKVLYR